MKKMLSLLALVAGALVWTSCGKTPKGPCGEDPGYRVDCAEDYNTHSPLVMGAGPVWDASKFTDYVNNQLDGQVTGWQVAVAFSGNPIRIDAGGLARGTQECNFAWMTACTRMNIASQSKTLTALATMHILDRAGISLGDEIGPYLPWNDVHESSKRLTFRQFMTHTAGLAAPAKNEPDELFRIEYDLRFDGLHTWLNNGVCNDNTRIYLNANFSIMRVVIPQIWKQLPDCPAELKNATLTAELAIKYYQLYVNQYVLGPAGVAKGGLPVEDIEHETLNYDVDNPGAPGKAWGDWSEVGGGGGWYLSSVDLVKALGQATKNPAILPADMKTQMFQDLLGFDSSWNTTIGTAYGKPGDLSGNGTEMHGYLTSFPNGITTCIMINSNGHPDLLSTITREAFEAGFQ